ncbi:hypothetical protein [Streptomyces sp. NPDC001380]|uniref:hypothetical protein n=1 Tax=Streptomyces sp. NPDC001380 TaxID=3364566 RepID=UPI00369B03AE
MNLLPAFEEVSSEGREMFGIVRAAERVGLLPESLREPLSAYLGNCPTLMVTSNVHDPLDLSKGMAVPFGVATDGVWVWPLYWGYFVREYGIAVPDEFITHARARGFHPPELTMDDSDRIAEELTRQAG